jgi:hypothetical protein
VERKRSILIAHGSALRVTAQQHFDGLNRGLPHGSLVDRKVSSRVGLGSTTRVRLEERLDDIGSRLEGASSVQWEVTTLVQTRRFFGKGRIL